MKVTIAVPLAILLLSPAWAQQGKPTAVAEEIRSLEEKYNAAYAANDLPLYFSFLAEDFTQFLPSGRTDKPAYQKSWTRFITGGGKVEQADFSDLVIQVSPSADSAVASYLLHVKTHSTRGDSDELFQESDVWFKRGGEWKVVHLNYAPARKKTPPAAQ